MMWWILMERIVPCLWIGQSTHQTFLGPIRYVLAFLFLWPYFFLAYWMAHDLVDLCFRLMWILWRKSCRWLEACNRWLVLSPSKMCLMTWARYAKMLFECLWLRLFLMMKLTLGLTDFFRHIEWKLLIPPKGLWRRGSRASNLKIVSMILNFS